MMTLPKDLILNSSERAEVMRHIGDLDPFTRLDQAIVIREMTLSNDQALGTMIAALLLKGGRKLDKESADAATEDYLDALEDMPAWSVREAIRKWNRGESPTLDGKKHDFNWRPEPPTLRRLSSHEFAGVKARILALRKLLEAVERIEFSDEHRQEMLNKVAELFKQPVVAPMAPQTTQEAAE